jgi:hypothetical protein
MGSRMMASETDKAATIMQIRRFMGITSDGCV